MGLWWVFFYFYLFLFNRQSLFYENYFGSERENTFGNVKSLIYTFDVKNLTGSEKDVYFFNVQTDLEFFSKTIEALHELSPDAHIFIIITKIDLIPNHKKDQVYKDTRKYVEDIITSSNYLDKEKIDFFYTSIWDQTIYNAWGEIVCSLIPDLPNLQNKLQKLCNVCQAREIFLYERSTFLLIASAKNSSTEPIDNNRFSELSDVLKGLVNLCNKSKYVFESIHIKKKKLNLYIDLLSPNTYIVVALSRMDVCIFINYIQILVL